MKLGEYTPEDIEVEYLESLRKGTLMIQRCESCGARQFYPRLRCKFCHTNTVRFEPSDGRGKLYSFTRVHRAPERFKDEAPYTIGLVELEPGLRIPGLVRGPDALLKIDAEVAFSSGEEFVGNMVPLFALVQAEGAS